MSRTRPSTKARRLAAHRTGRPFEWSNRQYFWTGKRGVSIRTGHPSAEYEWYTIGGRRTGSRVWLDLVTGEVGPE